jgi:tetratricopeptide (TPR) repeat protein
MGGGLIFPIRSLSTYTDAAGKPPAATIEMTIEDAFNLGAQHQQAGRLAEAGVVYRHILTQVPNHPEALYRLGVLAQQIGQCPTAMQLVTQAIKLASGRAEFHGTFGELLEQCGRFDEAEAAYQTALALNHDLFGTHNNLANILSRKGQYKEAAAHFKQAMGLRPDLAVFPFGLATAYAKMGRMKEAIALFRSAIVLQPGFLEARENLGHALLIAEGNDEAIAQFKEALAVAEAMPASARTSPGHTQSVARILISLADAVGGNGQFDQAIPLYERALKLAPDQFNTLSNYGVCLLHLNRYEQVVAVSRAELDRQPNLPLLHYNLGAALHRLGRRDEARVAYLKALSLMAPSEERMILADELLGALLFDEAIEGYRQMAARGNHSWDQSAYWGLMQSSQAKALASAAVSGEGPAKTPYLGDKVVLLHCDRAVRERLRAAGLHGGYAIDPVDGTEIWLSAQLAAQPDAGKLTPLVEQWLEWIRNEAAMAGTTCTVWMPQMPQAVADVVRRAAGEDLIEVGGDSAEEIVAKLASRAIKPPDTEDKFFAVVSIRNGGLELLPHWLAHYTKLGVNEILLGIFDDLAGDARAEIEKCAGQWKFRTFVQRWKAATESETYCQRQSGCRRAGARPGTWILHTDLDELQQYPLPLKKIAADAAQHNVNAVFGRLIDRVAADGSLPPIWPRPSLWEQFPIECNMTGGILKSSPAKVMMARFRVLVKTGHHETPLEREITPPIGKVAHFKWHSGLLERMRWGLRQENASREWKGDARRFLAWLESNGGKINLSDPELVRIY